MDATNEMPVIVATWAGTVNNDWYEKAEELLKTVLNEYFTYSFKGVGLFGDLKIVSKQTSSQLTFNVDAKGKTRGVVKKMGDDTYVFLLFIMALSKLASFSMADKDSKTPRISCNPDNPFFKDLNVDQTKLEELGVLLGITISDKKRSMPGTAVFF